MAFPSVSDVTETGITGNPTSWVFNLPATVSPGDLLILFCALERNQSGETVADSTSDSWIQLHLFSTGGLVTGIWAKVADGDEDGGTVTLDASSTTACNAAGQVYRIAAASWRGTLADDVDIAADSSATTTATPDPPAVTAGWGAEDNLYITFYGGRNDDATVSSYPTNYANGIDTLSGGGNNDAAEIGTARRELNAANDNPGTFTISQTEVIIAATLVIRPAAAAAGRIMSSLAGAGGLAGHGGIAGQGGGLAA